MLHRAVLLQPSGFDGGRRTAVADERRTVGAARAVSAAVLAAGTGTAWPQAGQSIVRATKRAVDVSRAPQEQANRILSSTGAAPVWDLPHLGQPAGLAKESYVRPHGQLT
jgi:hypothetical protein